MQATMNLKIKFRESFRPFAPCVLQERVSDYFGMRPDQESPYMLLVAPVREKHRVPLSEADRQKMTAAARTCGTASTSSAPPSRPSRTWTTARACRRWTKRGTGGSTA